MQKRQNPENDTGWSELTDKIKSWGMELGFQQVGISHTQLSETEARLLRWLDKGFHGEMEYMAKHGNKRTRPQELVENTLSIISLRMDYWPQEAMNAEACLHTPDLGYISRYALGRDYHKTVRNRLQTLSKRIENEVGEFGYRVFCDSAPVMEKPIAANAGLGWVGKHTNLINQSAGSWFFLGEIYTDLPLPADPSSNDHCGTCRSCIDACPTDAITAPYELDARRCISYLTIELHGAIPVEFRSAIGNRIYGCDDCQIYCPWNRFATATDNPDFTVRHQLDSSELLTLFSWSEDEFLKKMEGSPIRRLGYQRWIRNIAVALGNAPSSAVIIDALEKHDHTDELINEHIQWALEKQRKNTE